MSILLREKDISGSTPCILNEDLPSKPAYPWKGKYYTGNAIEAEAIPAPGYVFSHWQGSIHNENPVIIIDSQNDFDLIAHFIEEYPTKREIISFWYFNNPTCQTIPPLNQLNPGIANGKNRSSADFSFIAGRLSFSS
jgi:hypothetical protein